MQTEAFQVGSPPPQGFSQQASFSSMTTRVDTAAEAKRSAVIAPAGPPPSTATFIWPRDLTGGCPGGRADRTSSGDGTAAVDRKAQKGAACGTLTRCIVSTDGSVSSLIVPGLHVALGDLPLIALTLQRVLHDDARRNALDCLSGRKLICASSSLSRKETGVDVDVSMAEYRPSMKCL